MESRASSGLEEKYNIRAVMQTSDGEGTVCLYSTADHGCQSLIVTADNLIAAEHRIKDVTDSKVWLI